MQTEQEENDIHLKTLKTDHNNDAHQAENIFTFQNNGKNALVTDRKKLSVYNNWI